MKHLCIENELQVFISGFKAKQIEKKSKTHFSKTWPTTKSFTNQIPCIGVSGERGNRVLQMFKQCQIFDISLEFARNLLAAHSTTTFRMRCAVNTYIHFVIYRKQLTTITRLLQFLGLFFFRSLFLPLGFPLFCSRWLLILMAQRERERDKQIVAISRQIEINYRD